MEQTIEYIYTEGLSLQRSRSSAGCLSTFFPLLLFDVGEICCIAKWYFAGRNADSFPEVWRNNTHAPVFRLNKSSACRLLKSLQSHGYVAQTNIPGSYRLTSRLAAVGFKAYSLFNSYYLFSLKTSVIRRTSEPHRLGGRPPGEFGAGIFPAGGERSLCVLPAAKHERPPSSEKHLPQTSLRPRS